VRVKDPFAFDTRPELVKNIYYFPNFGYFNEAPLIFDKTRGEKRFSFLFTVSIRALFSNIKCTI